MISESMLNGHSLHTGRQINIRGADGSTRGRAQHRHSHDDPSGRDPSPRKPVDVCDFHARSGPEHAPAKSILKSFLIFESTSYTIKV